MSSMTGFKANAPTGAQRAGKVGGYNQVQIPQFTPDQMQLFQQMFSNVSPNSYLSKLAGGDQETFNQMEAPAMRQFQGLQGQMASRFSGVGGLGARRSSGFQNTMNQASSDFAQDLQSRRHQMQSDAIQQLMGLSGQLLGQRPYENVLMKKEPSFWKQLLLGANETGKETAGMAAKMAMMG